MREARLESLEDFRVYRRELSARRVEDDPVVKAWQVARRLTWLALLANSFLCYYLLSTLNEALSLPRLVVSAPVRVIVPVPPPSSPR